MKVGLEKSYPMPGSPEVVWDFLQNIEGVARCMPGAKITERIDDSHYKGTISVRVGPAAMAFKGDIEVRELDAARHTLRLIGKGSDSTGTSGASMDLTARIEPGTTPDVSNLVGKSEVTMSGKAAAFGGRMMGTVADQILNQFAGNFARQITAAAKPAAVAPPVVPAAEMLPGEPASLSISSLPSSLIEAAAAPLKGPITGPIAGPTAAASAQAPALPAAPVPRPAPAAPSALSTSVTAGGFAEEPPNEINALALMWAIIRDWFRGLFRRKTA